MNKITYEEYLEAKAEASCKFALSERKKTMANSMFKILRAEHQGKENAICADALAEEMSIMTGEDINRGHVNECARLFRVTGRFPGLQSCTKGYYVDESYQAMVNTLRFVLTKSAQIENTAYHIRDVIVKKYGDDALPDDLREWLSQLEYEEWCEENNIEND